MSANRMRLIARISLAAIALALVSAASLYAAGSITRAATNNDVIGSWFGRAIPVPGKTICPAGSTGCPVPAEIIMVFTIHADGTFIGIDSNIFAGGSHTTAHGQWGFSGTNSIKAAFTFLQSNPTNAVGLQSAFIGGFKNIFQATLTTSDQMTGQIDAYLYNYVDANGAVLLDSNGFPTPSPLAPPESCASTKGCTSLGQFSFKVQRVAPVIP